MNKFRTVSNPKKYLSVSPPNSSPFLLDVAIVGFCLKKFQIVSIPQKNDFLIFRHIIVFFWKGDDYGVLYEDVSDYKQSIKIHIEIRKPQKWNTTFILPTSI